MRTFVAIDLPDPGAIPGWRPRASGAPTHLTLRFLGEVEPERLPPLGEGLARVASRHAPFGVGLAGLDAFPDRERPRIVYLAVTTGREELVAIAADVEGELGELGFPRERRPFRPHVTLGRIRSAKDAERFRRALEAAGEGPRLAADVDALVLKASELGPSGALHTTLDRFPLGPGPGRAGPSPGPLGGHRQD